MTETMIHAAEQPNPKKKLGRAGTAAIIGTAALFIGYSAGNNDAPGPRAASVPTAFRTVEVTRTPEPVVSTVTAYATVEVTVESTVTITEPPVAPAQPVPVAAPVEPEPEPSTSEPEPAREATRRKPEREKKTSYKNCDEVRRAGAAPLYAGQPGYSRKLDRDKDGVACDE